METESKGGNREMSNSASVSNGTASRKGSEKQGFVKRFLKWIARGTDQSGMNRGSCPT